jgi:excisionase family DNA binding protein
MDRTASNSKERGAISAILAGTAQAGSIRFHANGNRNLRSDPQMANRVRAAMPETIALIDINELSRRISIPKGTLYNLVYLRRIPFIKRGRSLRFDPQEVLRSLPRYDTMDLAGQRWKGH